MKTEPTVIRAPVKIRKRKRAGSWRTFERRYKPIEGPDGSFQRDHRTIGDETDARFVWTIVEAEGRLYVVPGFATVNYVSRVLCENPWSDIEFECPGYIW